jgi:hypothetical protein
MRHQQELLDVSEHLLRRPTLSKIASIKVNGTGSVLFAHEVLRLTPPTNEMNINVSFKQACVETAEMYEHL